MTGHIEESDPLRLIEAKIFAMRELQNCDSEIRDELEVVQKDIIESTFHQALACTEEIMFEPLEPVSDEDEVISDQDLDELLAGSSDPFSHIPAARPQLDSGLITKGINLLKELD